MTIRELGVAGLALCAALPATAGGGAGRKSASFNLTAVHAGSGMEVTVQSRVWVTATQARAEVRHPLEGEMIFLVSNGSFYQLERKTKRGIKAPLPPEVRKRTDNFDHFFTRFAFDASGALKMAKKKGTESVSGYQCDVFANTITKGDACRTITVWVPQKLEPPLPVKAIMQTRLSRPGATMDESITITLSNLQVNVPISPSVFAVPTGYKIVSGNPERPPGGR